MRRWISFTFLLTLGLILGGCPPSTESVIRTESENLLTYQKFREWDKVWDMLHPDSQAFWSSRPDFVRERRDAWEGVSLKDYMIGDIRMASQWYFDETDKTYLDVAEIQLTVVLSTVFGDVEHSQIMHSVNVDGRWQFFMVRADM